MNTLGKYLFVGFVSLVCSISIAQAQVPISINGLELTASTDNPFPGQKITVTARSYSIDINSANVSWTVGGKNAGKGTGLTAIEVTAPKLGTRLTVSASAITPEGRQVSSSIIISSGSVDMIIETDGYVPAFFSGKVPAIYQNTIKIVAVPHIADENGSEYDPKNLIYKWKKNSTVLEDKSGYGKQYLLVNGEIVPRDYTITVEVSSLDGKARTEGNISVVLQAPSLAFYIYDPLYGPLFNKSVDSPLRIGTQREVSVLAVPFGFNKPTNSAGNLSFSWMVNNISQSDLEQSQSIVLRSPETAGTSQVLLTIRNNKNILQTARGGFDIVFGPTDKENNMSEPVTMWPFIKQAHAEDNTTYKLLEALPCIETASLKCPEGSGSLTQTVPLNDYIIYAINLLIALSAVAAVFMITLGGFQYMTTDSWQTSKEGISKVKNAIYGLLLILCSYIILRTVNPKLVEIPATLVPALTSVNTKDSFSSKDFFDQIENDINKLKYATNQFKTERAAAELTAIEAQNEKNILNSKLTELKKTLADNDPQIQSLKVEIARIDQKINSSEATALYNARFADFSSAIESAIIDVPNPDRDYYEIINTITNKYAVTKTMVGTSGANLYSSLTNEQRDSLDDQKQYTLGVLFILQAAKAGVSEDLISRKLPSNERIKLVQKTVDGFAPTIKNPALSEQLKKDGATAIEALKKGTI